MTVEQMMHRIEEKIPTDRALDWDNVGLLVGDKKAQVKKIYLALDATDEVIDHAIAWGADALLTHHPLIFSGMKQVTEDTFLGRRIRRLIQNDISCYAMHTNFDVCVMGNLAAEKLGLKHVTVLDAQGEEPYGIGCVGELEHPLTLQELAEMTTEKFGISHVKVFGDPEQRAERIALCPGSGKSEMRCVKAAGAGVYITGDIDHHTGIDAVADGISVIDAGHYGVEHIYMEYMEQFLREILPEVEVASEPLKEPFWICQKR